MAPTRQAWGVKKGLLCAYQAAGQITQSPPVRSGSGEVSVLQSWLAEREQPESEGHGMVAAVVPLTCPFSEPRANPGLVAHAPHLEGPEERVRGSQGQVGNGARAHPV